MGTLNHPQTSHVVMPMNSEARDLGVLNKHMLSTTIRFFKSNIIFYMNISCAGMSVIEVF